MRISTLAGWTGQFGVPMERGEALAAFRDALDAKGVKVVGLHAHRSVHIRSAA